MMPSCKQCSAVFEITQSDMDFYEKVSPKFGGNTYVIPPPRLCPGCRMQRRLSYRNERSLHHRKCDKTGRSIVSMYAPEAPFPVYDNDVWWGDDWDPMAAGKPYDASKPFMSQFFDMWTAVPKTARVQQGENENSRYTNCASDNKNCYLIFSAANNEDCLYSTNIDACKNCVDCVSVYRSELCYECVDSENCYKGTSLRNCVNCSDCTLCQHCIGCQHCFGSINLRNKTYCFFNEQLTKQEYEARMDTLNKNGTHLRAACEYAQQFFLQHPHRLYEGVQNENVSGNQVSHSRNVHHCFESTYLEDCAYCDGVRNAKDSHDVSYYGVTSTNELLYECEGVGHGATRVLFSKLVWGGSSDCLYCYECFACQNIFGCTGLRHKQYCILNRQYSKEEYEALMPQIIERMQASGEWGEFFPMQRSPFGYNESAAQQYYALSEEDVRSRHLLWRPMVTSDQYLGPQTETADGIDGVADDILEKILLCETTEKPYKIIPQELKFYREMHIPLPRKCPDQRHKERMALRNPRHLWNRTCAKCSEPIQTTYAPERQETVYCERCYLEAVY